MTSSKERVFVALSGGVDSSVAAALLKERGFNVMGIHMKMWSPAEAGKPETRNPKSESGERFDDVCRQQRQDRLDAMRVAAALDIPFQTWDFSEQYRRAVVEYLIREYAAGRTPNPDVMCNREIKFGLFLRRALEMGADYIATGHYVRREPEFPIINSQFSNNASIFQFSNLKIGLFKNSLKIVNCKLKIAADLNKDQSYFLWTLNQEQLKHCLFPIGEYAKPEVRALARKFGLPTAEKPDSQGICFIGEIDVREFLKKHIPERRGRVLTTAGRAIGEHSGVEFYTIGQRHGLGIGGAPSAPNGHAERGGGIPYYVTEKDPDSNTLTVAEGPYDAGLFRRELVATGVNWIFGKAPQLPLRCLARIRYRQPLQRCTIQAGENDKSAFGLGEIESSSPSGAIHQAKPFSNLIITFDEPQRAVTPGQSVVFYRNGELIGGGIIR